MNADNFTWEAPPRHINKYMDATSTVVPGWEYQVRDGVTGSVVPVFVPDANLGKEQVQVLVMHELTKLRDIHTLGS